MPEQLGPSPYVWLTFDKEGTLRNPAALDRLNALLTETDATDLLVISHGWKNDEAAALRIYQPLWERTAPMLEAGRRFVVAGVLWPSVPFREHFDEPALLKAAAEGGVLSTEDSLPVEDLDDEHLRQALDDFLDGDDDPELRNLIGEAEQDLSGEAAAELFQRALARVQRSVDALDAETRPELQPLVEREQPAGALLDLSPPPLPKVEPTVGGGLGVVDDVKKAFAGAKAAIARLLGQLTYFEMKVRAGVVGAKLGEALARRPADAVRLHLVGHSFGARLVTAAADALVKAGRTVDSLTLLQGAFSHNALSPNFEGKPGAFAGLVGKVGVIAITHTHNDRACTLAYAVASRFSRDVAKSIGDAQDSFGAMGANGAQNVAVVTHTDVPGPTALPSRGAINNYRADRYIVGNPVGKDAHGDVFNPTVARLLSSVLRA